MGNTTALINRINIMDYETFKEMLDRLLKVEETIEQHLDVELAHVHAILEREHPEYTKRFWGEVS
jgi:hypothetical protein